MKTAILTFLVIIAAFSVTPAQTSETVELRSGEMKLVAKGKLNVRFISVLEDSRCPARAVCVWAGNAKVRIEIASRHHSPKRLELNTGLDPHEIKFEGYAVKLIAVTPRPGEGRMGRQARQSITISVKRL